MCWMQRLCHVPALLLTILTLVAIAGDCSEAPEDEFVAWAARTRIPLERPALAGYLDDALQGKRIVYLGASDHWIREKYAYRLALLRPLFERGWRTIGMEMDLCDARRVDRYLATGDDALLEGVALYGYAGGRREDRDDAPKGFPGFRNPALRAAFVAEERLFLRTLRSWNEGLAPGEPRLRWFGFDVGLLPSVGYEEIQALLAGHEGEPLVGELRARLERVPRETRPGEATRLEALHVWLDERPEDLARALGERPSRELRRVVAQMAASLRFLDAAQEGPSTYEWLASLPVRERGMCTRMDEFLGEAPDGEKIVLLGHNLHLSLDSEHICFGPVGAPAPSMWPSLGTHLGRRFPGEVLAIWMSYDHGRHGTVLAEEGFEEVLSVPGTVEHLLAQVGTGFLLGLRGSAAAAEYLGEPRMFRQNASVASGVLADQAHALVFYAGATGPGGR